nr:hypothetical protein Iba_chr02aCG3070 [Ipomoea batatas]
MERGSSRLNASIFLNSSSKAWRKQLSFDNFKETSPVADTSARQSEMVLGTPNSLFKSILSFLPSGPIRSLNFLIRDFGFLSEPSDTLSPANGEGFILALVSVIRKTRAKLGLHKRKRIVDGESHKDSDSFHIRWILQGKETGEKQQKQEDLNE